MDKKRPLLLALLMLWLTRPAACEAPAGRVVAVLSSETGPYQEALAGLKQELGEVVPTFFLSKGEPRIPRAARVVVAFGSKAALKSYPNGTALVYAMAPGTLIESPTAAKICMEPEHALLLKNMKTLYPGLKRLGVFWVSPRFESYADELRAATRSDMTIAAAALENSADVPDLLRKLHGEIDALWLPPDPLLINAASLSVIMEFSRSNKVPVFVATAGLVERGATASIGPSFREMGRQAGAAALKALNGSLRERKIYSPNVEVVINRSVAAQVGLP